MDLHAYLSSMISALKGQSGPILVGVVSWTFATLQKHQFETRQAEGRIFNSFKFKLSNNVFC